MNSEEDLGLKIGTVEEKAWTDILDRAEKEILISKREIDINEAIITLSKAKIAEEKEKFK